MANNVNSFYYDPYSSGVGSYYDDEVGGGTSITESLVLKNNSGVFGIPYQFLSSVDRRLDDNGRMAGRKYAEKILGRLPLLFLVPCSQKFMEGFSSQDQSDVINDLISGNGISSNLEKTGRYYTTQYQYDNYYAIVNRMSTVMAAYMGLGNVPVIKGDGSSVALKDVAWQDMNSNDLKNYFMVKHAAVFYADGLTSISDSFSNSTMESSLANSINGFSDQAKEVKFLLGGSSLLSDLATGAGEGITSAIQGSGLQGISEFLTGGMISDLATTGVSTVLSGGKLIFPKLWSDSNFSRSYSFDIKLRSPDHDSLSIFMNVIIPYLHLLALVMPRSITEDITAKQSPNAYSSPFLVRAYAKGMFNINMGLITDLSATRGAACEWNVDGLPTQIDISLTIEDLYSSLFITDPYGAGPINTNWDLVTNTEFMDFLANLGGLNVATQVSNRKAKMLTYLTSAGIARAPSTIYTYFENAVSNKLRQLWDILN